MSLINGAKLEIFIGMAILFGLLITISKGFSLNASLKPIEGEAPMLTSLEIFQSAQAMARHAASQQSMVARNIANADTPGFKAMVMPDLEETATTLPMKTGAPQTRTGHISFAGQVGAVKPVVDRDATTAPNGNSVSVEMETLKSIEAERAHSRAMTVYQSALTILRTSIGRGR